MQVPSLAQEALVGALLVVLYATAWFGWLIFGLLPFLLPGLLYLGLRYGLPAGVQSVARGFALVWSGLRQAVQLALPRPAWS